MLDMWHLDATDFTLDSLALLF